jgi:hypothetical protein
MEISINYVAVILAALSTMVVGSIWYTPKVFGNLWMKLGNIKPDPTFNNKKAAYLYIGAFLTSLVTAFVLAYFTGIVNRVSSDGFTSAALLSGLLGWLGFTAARIHMHDSFERRRKKLTLLNVTHEFVTIMIMALIIGLMGA